MLDHFEADDDRELTVPLREIILGRTDIELQVVMLVLLRDLDP
ncbi:MAG TPA: hypothetical protein VGQ76_10685 [Thermoanaerobaculia bacterium]|nr:hypothetical protein [Thermoanaerobaculia bacterium]